MCKDFLCVSKKKIFPLQVSHYFKTVFCTSKQKEYLCFTNYNFIIHARNWSTITAWNIALLEFAGVARTQSKHWKHFPESSIFTTTNVKLCDEFVLLSWHIRGFSVNYCHFQLNSALAIADLFIWKQCQSNKEGLEFHIWVALWMTCSMWAPWDSRTAWRRNKNFCKTRLSIPLVTCAQLSWILSFSSGRVRGALLNTLSFR